MLVEGLKTVLGEGRRRAQLAGAERGQWPSCPLDVFRDPIKSLGERQQPVEPHPLDFKTRIGRGPARILKHGGDEAVVAGLEWLRGHGRALPDCRGTMPCRRCWTQRTEISIHSCPGR